MTQEKTTTTKKRLERFELSNKPTVVIPTEFKKKIDFLHSKVGAFEWSGELITSEEGNINSLDDWKITCEEIFLADIGSHAYTEYEIGKGGFKSADIIELYETYPEILEGKLKLHHIHSHNNFSTFFSGTDWENLEDRASLSNYFLMLIVNFDGKYCAKVAFKAKKEGGKATKLTFVNNEDGLKPLNLTGVDDLEVLVVMDCKIEMEEVVVSVSDEFEKRYESVVNSIKEEAEKNKKAKLVKPYGGMTTVKGKDEKSWSYDDDYYDEGGGYAPEMSHYGGGSPDEWELEGGMWKNVKDKQKKIGELTSKEWEDVQAEESKMGIFELRHARVLLNSILTGIIDPTDFSDPITKIKNQDKALKTASNLENYVLDSQANFRDNFDMLFYGKPVSDYKELMYVVSEFLFPYQYIRLAKELMELAEEEAMLN